MPALKPITLALIFASKALGASLVLPPFSGDFSVGSSQFPLTDNSRDDPLTGTKHKREVLVSLFYPTTPDASSRFPPAPYAPKKSIELFGQFLNISNASILNELRTNVTTGSPVNYGPAHATRPSNSSRVKGSNGAGCITSYGGQAGPGKLPLVLFSPGLNGLVWNYEHMIADLASNGYLVAAIDSPGDGFFVEFPDGRIIQANPRFNSALWVDGDPSAAEIQLRFAQTQDVRVADMEYVMNTLLSPEFTIPGMPVGSAISIDSSKIGAFGHSLGGSSTAFLMAANENIKCGLNMDGSFFNNSNVDLKRPFMWMAAANHLLAVDDTPQKFFAGQQTVKPVAKKVKDTMHDAYTDLPIILDLLGVDRNQTREFNPGSISGERMNLINNAYIRAFFNKNLKGEDDGLLDEETDREFPEVFDGTK